MAGHVEYGLASDVGAVHLSAAHGALIELVLGKSELREALTNDAGQGGSSDGIGATLLA